MLELVRIDVERDARACVAELAGRANRIDARADEVARERVSEVMKSELGHVVPVKACRVPVLLGASPPEGVDPIVS